MHEIDNKVLSKVSNPSLVQVIEIGIIEACGYLSASGELSAIFNISYLYQVSFRFVKYKLNGIPFN